LTLTVAWGGVYLRHLRADLASRIRPWNATRAALAPPVVLTGRGGSGTRLLAGLAQHAGLRLGNLLNESGDSLEWVPLIYGMVKELGTGSELPRVSDLRLRLRQQALTILRGQGNAAAGSWGLKLPETMLVLPLFEAAFPGAKFVHLVRHPVSVALGRPHRTARVDDPLGALLLPAAYRYVGRDISRIDTDASYLHNAIAWEYQVRRAVGYGRRLVGAGRYLEIHYERLCADQPGTLRALRAFLGHSAGEQRPPLRIDPARDPRWDPADDRVRRIWDVCGATASMLGYRSAGGLLSG
jgi:hypothetical protein